MLNYFFVQKIKLENVGESYNSKIEQKPVLKNTNKSIVRNYLSTEEILQGGTESNLSWMNMQHFFPEDKILESLNCLFSKEKLVFLVIKSFVVQNIKFESLHFDYIAFSKNVILLIGVSYGRYEKGIETLVQGLERFRESFPEFNSFCVHGAYGSERLSKTEIAIANELGIYIVKKKGDLFKFKNSKNFSPRDW